MPSLVRSPEACAQSTVEVHIPGAAGHPASRVWQEFSELTGLPFAVAHLTAARDRHPAAFSRTGSKQLVARSRLQSRGLRRLSGGPSRG